MRIALKTVAFLVLLYVAVVALGYARGFVVDVLAMPDELQWLSDGATVIAHSQSSARAWYWVGRNARPVSEEERNWP
jgi:hypothetical protein